MGEFRYNQSDIHLCYDESRRLSPGTLTLWMEAISKYVPPDSIRTIIDLGCGTGRFTGVLSSHFSARVVGIDPSLKMLTAFRRAGLAPLIVVIQGMAESIPLADGGCDLAFLSMVYHHFQDKARAVGEMARVLKGGGFLCLRTATLESIDTYPWVRFFPRARRIEASRLPSRESLAATLQAGGFELLGHTVVRQCFAQNHREYFRKISLRGISSLKALTDGEFQEGLASFRQYCRENDTGDAVFEDINLFVFRADSLEAVRPTTALHQRPYSRPMNSIRRLTGRQAVDPPRR